MKKTIAAAVSLLCLSVPALYAGLSIQPARAEINIQAGGSYEGSYSVMNQSDEPSVVNVEFRDWFNLPENKDIHAEQWLEVPERQISLGAGEARDVKYIVHVPSSAAGVLVGMVSFVPEAREGENITMVISAGLFVTVRGTERTAWSIKDIRLVKTAMNTLQASVDVTNNGNVHLRPHGELSILKKGQAVATLNFGEGRPVYPGSFRPLVANSETPAFLEPGKYSLRAVVTAGGETKEITAKLKVAKNGGFKTK